MEDLIMKYKFLIAVVGLSLLFSACSSPAKSAATPTAIPTVLADNTIIAEGRLEPVRYAEIAFNASGVVSDAGVERFRQKRHHRSAHLAVA